MPLIEINLHPERHQLRVFGLALAAILGFFAWRFHWLFGIPALVVAAVAAAFPMALRWVFVAMMVVPYPLGLAVSWFILGLIYYGVVTPLGWVAKLCGRDLLMLRPRPDATTFWMKRKATPTRKSYFNQW